MSFSPVGAQADSASAAASSEWLYSVIFTKTQEAMHF